MPYRGPRVAQSPPKLREPRVEIRDALRDEIRAIVAQEVNVWSQKHVSPEAYDSLVASMRILIERADGSSGAPKH